VVFDHWIPRLSVRRFVPTSLRFARLVEAFAVGCEQPAVVGTADPVVFDLSDVEGRSTMATPRLQQTGGAAAIAVENQVLTQNSDVSWTSRCFIDRGKGMPITTEEFTRRRPGTHFDQLSVRGPHPAPVGPSVVGWRLSGHSTLCAKTGNQAKVRRQSPCRRPLPRNEMTMCRPSLSIGDFGPC
jgi:hypothetical protein